MRLAAASRIRRPGVCGFQSQPSGCACRMRSNSGVGHRRRRRARDGGGSHRRRLHATSQIVHSTRRLKALTAWVRGVNAHLPATATMLWAQPVGDDFHAPLRGRSAAHYSYLMLIGRTDRVSTRVAWAGTIFRSMWTRCAPVPAAARSTTSRRSGRGVPGEVAGEDHARGSTSPPQVLLRFDLSADAFLHHMSAISSFTVVYVGRPACRRRGSARCSGARPPRARPDVCGRWALFHRCRLRSALHLPATRREFALANGVTRCAHDQICGITRVDDGVVAAREGADAIGVVFCRGRRAASLMNARARSPRRCHRSFRSSDCSSILRRARFLPRWPRCHSTRCNSTAANACVLRWSSAAVPKAIPVKKGSIC